MGEKKELRQVARQLGRGELEEEFVRLTVERNGLKQRLRAANDGQRVLAEKAERYREANHALKDAVVRLNGENARLKEEVARLRRSAPSGREFDIWNR